MAYNSPELEIIKVNDILAQSIEDIEDYPVY